MNATRFPIPILLALAGPYVSVDAADVPSWRNGGNGLYPGAEAVSDWTKESAVKWETPLPAPSNASPILVGGKLFFTAEPAVLVCADAESGKILWHKTNGYADLMGDGAESKAAQAAAEKAEEIGKKAAPLERELYRIERRLRRDRERDRDEMTKRAEELKAEIAELRKDLDPADSALRKPPTHDTNGYSSYTPVSDGKKVWACFGTGVVVCHDLEGKRIWHKRTENPDHDWGGSSSPTLVDGKLILRFKDYVALDPETGDEIWRTPAAGIAFNCPASFELEGRHYLYTARGELIRASDGKKLPSQDFTNDAKPWAFFNTPSVVGNRIYCASGSEGQQGDAYGLEIPSTVEELEKSGLKQVWHTQVDKNRYYSSPLVHDGIVYLIGREYQLQALDTGSGGVFYSEKVKGMTGTAYPSLTLAGDRIVVGAEDGNVAFIKPGRVYEELDRTKVGPFRSTPIFDGKIGYLRTQDKLMAVRAE